MWLAVQQLLVGAAAGNGGRQTLQRLAEKFPVRVNKPWGLGAVTEQRLCLRDAISEMRRRPLDLLHAGMQPHERLRILRWRDWGRQGLVVGPKGDDEAVTQVDARLHPRIERGHRAAGCCQAPSDLNFEF